MATREEVLQAFIEWARNTRKARDSAIEMAKTEITKRMIRQVYNVKITTIAEATDAVKAIGKDDEPLKPLIQLPSGGKH